MKKSQLIAAAVIVVVVAAVSAVVLFGPALQPRPADYEIDIPAGLSPHMTAQAAADVAVGYLNSQTPALAAPELHTAPRVTRVGAALAADVRTLEPAVRPDTAQAQPTRIVWVVAASGDFLNLTDLEWSRASDPARVGSVVIDDATGTIIGVYPHVFGRPGGPSPVQSRP